jgi:hypothetical protein
MYRSSCRSTWWEASITLQYVCVTEWQEMDATVDEPAAYRCLYQRPIFSDCSDLYFLHSQINIKLRSQKRRAGVEGGEFFHHLFPFLVIPTFRNWFPLLLLLLLLLLVVVVVVSSSSSFSIYSPLLLGGGLLESADLNNRSRRFTPAIMNEVCRAPEGYLL